MLHDLQREALPLALPGPAILGLLLVLGAGSFPDPLSAGLLGILLMLTALAAIGLHGWRPLAAAWTLVLGTLAAELLMVTWGQGAPALALLAVPVALSCLFVSPLAGLCLAALCSLLLPLAPSTLLPASLGLRLAALLGVWSTLGILALALQPLLTAMDWSWSSYEQSRRLLEQARDTQVRLKETLTDLADANLQLTRLNRLAQGLRQAAEEARRAKEQFVANVSHELRTPLNMIVGFAEMILQTPEAYGPHIPPTLLADLAVIERNSQHLSSLVDDVLDLSQIEAGRMALTRERVDLAEIIAAAMAAVRPLFASKGLRLESEITPGLPPVFCDRTRIREVVLNLLSNAGRFTEEGGVRVRARRAEGDVVVSVTDTGPGIAAEDLPRIFQPFQQLDPSLRRRHGGTGLGLAISKSFVELHGGRMWLESEKGHGTTFHFRLPVDPPEAPESALPRWFSPHWHYEERTRRPAAPPAQPRPRLVVCETGHTLQRLLARYLDGTEIVPVPSLEQAAQELAHTPAQALLVNGPSVALSLQQVASRDALVDATPAIVCSLPEDDTALGALGVTGYLLKPISREALLAALDSLPGRTQTVLIVDDEPEAQQLFGRMLNCAGRGYRILTAANGREALAAVARERPDAILLDLLMPEMDGFQFLEVRSQDPALRSVPVLLISARDPAGQPIVASALAVTQRGGLSIPHFLACLAALTRILGTTADPADLRPVTGSQSKAPEGKQA